MKATCSTACLALIILAGTVTAFAERTAADVDQDKLQGEWSMVSGSADGTEMPANFLPSLKRVCKGDETTVTIGDQLMMKAKFKLDPSKTPKTIDYDAIDGPTKGRKHLGIYEFDGEQVRFCFGAPDAARPAEFSSPAGSGRTLSLWKRTVPAAKP